jgi:hypothetical protein
MRSHSRSTVRDEIDGALLVDVKSRGTPGELNRAGLKDDFDCGGEKDWIRRALLYAS